MADENTKSFTDTLSAISPFASMGANLFSGFLNNIFNKNSAEKQFERQKELQKIQQDYNMQAMERQNQLNNQSWFAQFQAQNRENRQMMLNKPSYDREGLVQAGFSPVSNISTFSPAVSGASGGTASMPSSGLGSAGMQSPSSINFGDFALMSLQSPLIRAQARKVNADAEAQELLNRGKKEANSIFGDNSATVTFSDIDPKNPNVLPDMEVKLDKPISTEEGYNAKLAIIKGLADKSSYNFTLAENRLKTIVANMQYDSPERVLALADRCVAEYDNLMKDKDVKDALKTMYIEQGNLYISETELNKLAKKAQENANLGVLLEKIFGSDTEPAPNASWYEKMKYEGKLMMKLLFLAVSGVGVSFNKRM